MHICLNDEEIFELSPWVYLNETREDWKDRHLLQMIDVAGEFPVKMEKKWGRRQRYFLEELDAKCWSEDDTRVMAGGMVKLYEIDRGHNVEGSIKAAIDGQKAVISGVNLEDKDAMVDIIKKCLALDRDMRPEARELLQHPFFNDV